MKHPFRNSGSGPARRMLGAAAVVCALTMTAHASPWSVVNLHPAGATGSSAWGVQSGQQVGAARVGGTFRASLWSGTAESWEDLNPAGAAQSYAYGVYGGQQVGNAVVGGVMRASLWNGTAASWVDLHAILPSGFTSSYAEGIWDDGAFTYVAGYGVTTTGQVEALMWLGPVPEPTSGLVLAAGLAALALLRRRRK